MIDFNHQCLRLHRLLTATFLLELSLLRSAIRQRNWTDKDVAMSTLIMKPSKIMIRQTSPQAGSAMTTLWSCVVTLKTMIDSSYNKHLLTYAITSPAHQRLSAARAQHPHYLETLPMMLQPYYF